MIIIVGSDLHKLKKRISNYIRSSNNMVNTEGQIRRSLQRLVSFERKVTFDPKFMLFHWNVPKGYDRR